MFTNFDLETMRAYQAKAKYCDVIFPSIGYTVTTAKSKAPRPKELKYEDAIVYDTPIDCDNPTFNGYRLSLLAMVHQHIETEYPEVVFEVYVSQVISVVVSIEYNNQLEEIRDSLIEALKVEEMWVLPIIVCSAGMTAAFKDLPGDAEDTGLLEVIGFMTEQSPLERARELSEFLGPVAAIKSHAESAPALQSIKVCRREPKANPMDIGGYWVPVDPFLDLTEDLPEDERKLAAHYLKGNMYG
jgi:hypothetical protein